MIHKSYKKYIDGLRGISILFVIGFHFFPDLIPGGFVGVDIFFVISGFLITQIILNNVKNDTFDLVDFYNRRIKRIFPSLIIVLIVSIFYGYLILLPHEFGSLVGNSYHSAAMLGNFYSFREINYFDVQSIYKPLLHLWSLSTEEQFYLLFPAVIILSYKNVFLKKHITAIIGILFALSFASNIILMDKKSIPFAFFMPYTRAWEILFGALLASFSTQSIVKINDRIGRNIISAIAIALIILSLVSFDSKTPYPGFRALLPTLGTVLIILSGEQALLNRKILSNRVLVWIGLISYPLYLVHWPILSFISIMQNGLPSLQSKLIILFVSTFLSWAIYYFIERKIRYSHYIPTKILIVCMLIILTISGYFYKINTDTFLMKKCPDIIKINEAIQDWDFPGSKVQSFHFENRICYKIGSGPQKIVFIGDSNMEQYIPRIVDVIDNDKTSNKTAIFITGGCHLPINNVYNPNHPNYLNYVNTVLNYINSEDIDSVVIGALWTGYFLKNSKYVYHKGDINALLEEEIGRNATLNELQIMVQSLVKSGKKVYIILNMPEGGEYDPKSFFKRSGWGIGKVEMKDADYNNWLKQTSSMNQQLIHIASISGAEIIDPAKHFCDNIVCKTSIDGCPLYRDGCHLRSSYVRKHIHFFDFLLKN